MTFKLSITAIVLAWGVVNCKHIKTNDGLQVWEQRTNAHQNGPMNPSFYEEKNSYQDGPITQNSDSRKVKCYGELGCFDFGGPFHHTIYRPINFVADQREVISTRFLLYRRGSGTKYERYLFDTPVSDIKKANFDKSLKTKFIVHGFIDNQFFGEWMRQVKDELLKQGNYNVFIVDWSKGNGLPYGQATANTRIVGAEIALFVGKLQQAFGVTPASVHIMGHSLGAHIAGYAGERLKNLERITGLDPAEPYFQHMPEVVRLDPSDAQFVDVIHSDALSIVKLGLGMDQPCGHVDFYPNDGREQPGCNVGGSIISLVTEGLFEGVRRFVACNHQRAVDFFMESITSAVIPMAYACPNYETFLAGSCHDCGDGSKCAPMGFRADVYKKNAKAGQQIRMYVKTHSSKPFLLHHYRVTVKLPVRSDNSEKGTLYVTLVGSKTSQQFKLNDKAHSLVYGASYSYLVTTGKNLGTLKGTTFKWDTSNLIIKPSLYVQKVTTVPLNVLDKSIQGKETFSACPANSNAIKSGQEATFIKC